MFLVLALALYFVGGREEYCLWFAILVGACMCRNLYLLVGDFPAGIALRNWIYSAATLAVLVCSVGLLGATSLVTRSSGNNKQSANWGASAYLVAGYLVLVALLAVWFGNDHVGAWVFVSRLLSVCALATGGYICYWLFRRAKLAGLIEFAVTLGLLLASATLVLHDSLQVLLPIEFEYQLSNLAGLPMVLFFCLMLVIKYAHQQRNLVVSNNQLEQQLEQRMEELNKAWSKIRQSEKTATLVEERARIMADMHDGVGGRLTTLLTQVKRGVPESQLLASSLEQSIQDLRFIIDSLNPLLSGDLAAAMGTLRERITPWLANSGLEVRWAITIDPGVELGATRVLNLYRFIQEALANVVQHGNADVVEIAMWREDGLLHLRLSDDGDGFAQKARQEGARLGYGMGNMQSRAAALAGSVRFESQDGAVILLSFSYPENSG